MVSSWLDSLISALVFAVFLLVLRPILACSFESPAFGPADGESTTHRSPENS